MKAVQQDIIACSIFRNELETIVRKRFPGISVQYYNSYLHLFPEKLYQDMQRKIDRKSKERKKVLLVCGDCHPFIKEMAEVESVKRTPGLNCIDLILGKDRRKALQKEGAFFLLPEWTLRWRTIFGELLNLPEEMIQNMLRESHSKLIYLDTGIVPVPLNEIGACAAFFQMPYEIMPVGLDHFEMVLVQEMNNSKDGDE